MPENISQLIGLVGLLVLVPILVYPYFRDLIRFEKRHRNKEKEKFAQQLDKRTQALKEDMEARKNHAD